jgi:hypothetical protein
MVMGKEEMIVQEEEQNLLNCKMFLGAKFYEQLNNDGKELFESTPEGFCATFTANLKDGITLGNCVMSFCEVAYIALNPKYQVDENTNVKCELYKNGKEDTTFSVLVTIEYPGEHKPNHELLIFAQRELTDSLYSFELVGDQTMFAM